MHNAYVNAFLKFQSDIRIIEWVITFKANLEQMTKAIRKMHVNAKYYIKTTKYYTKNTTSYSILNIA